MSETEPVEETKDFAETIREKIDDALDVVENFVAEKLSKLPAFARAPLEMSANGAFGTIRTIIGIPDDIGGDED